VGPNPTKINTTSGNINDATLKTITSLARQINCLDIERIAEICIEQIPRLIDARFASLYILDDRSDILRLQRCNHPFPINKIVSLNQNPPSLMATAVRSKNLMLVGNLDTHKLPRIRKSQRPYSANYKSNSCIIAPLICHGRIEGVLNFTDKLDADCFGNDDVALIELFRQFLGTSIGNIKLFEKIQRQAQTDGLTNLVNHRTFYELLEKELRRSQRHGGTISLIMIDIDNLKKINDSYGHRAGDMVIKQISRKITECIRQIDTAARYAGDEFTVILPNTSLSDAFAVAERIVAAVSNTPVIWDKQRIELSISAGVGQYNASQYPEDIMRYSDQALYAAKRAGKNRVIVFDKSDQYQNQPLSN